MADYCTAAEIKSDVGETSSTYDALLEALAEAVSDLIDAECQRGGRLHYRNVTEYFDINFRQRRYHPRNTPVVTVSGHYLKSDDQWIEDNDREVFAYPEYIEFETPFYSPTGSIYNPLTVVNLKQGLRVDMQVGFFAEDAIPKGLNMLCRQIAAKEYHRVKEKSDSSVKSKRIGNYSVTYRDASGADGMKADLQSAGMYSILDKYRKSLSYGLL